MFRGNLAHTGAYDAAGVPKLSGLKWKFHAGGLIVSSPAIAEGLVYVGSTDGNLYAVDAQSGAMKWKFKTKARVVSSPAVAGGLVYFSSYDGWFYAVDAMAGKLKWKFSNAGERRFAARHIHGSLPAAETMPDPFDCYLSSPAVWHDTVYFGSGDGNIYALNAATGGDSVEVPDRRGGPRLSCNFGRYAFYWKLGQLFLRDRCRERKGEMAFQDWRG